MTPRDLWSLVWAHRGLVWAVVNRQPATRLGIRDLEGYGLVGLYRAVELYDPARGTTLATYSRWWIRHAVTRAIADWGSTIRIPVHGVALRRAAERDDASCAALARRFRLSRRVVEDILTAPEEPCSLDGDVDGAPLLDAIPAPAPDPEAATLHREQVELLVAGMAALPETDRHIIAAAFGLAGRPLGLVALAAEIGLDAGAAAARLEEALGRLRGVCHA